MLFLRESLVPFGELSSSHSRRPSTGGDGKATLDEFLPFLRETLALVGLSWGPSTGPGTGVTGEATLTDVFLPFVPEDKEAWHGSSGSSSTGLVGFRFKFVLRKTVEVPCFLDAFCSFLLASSFPLRV